jgi:hypothetical protein
MLGPPLPEAPGWGMAAAGWYRGGPMRAIIARVILAMLLLVELALVPLEVNLIFWGFVVALVLLAVLFAAAFDEF